MNVEVKSTANVCVIGTSQLMMFEEAYADNVVQNPEGLRFLDIDSLKLHIFSAANSKYTAKAIDVQPGGGIRAKTNALAAAWELSAGEKATNVSDYDAVVLFGFRGVGKNVYSRNEIMC